MFKSVDKTHRCHMGLTTVVVLAFLASGCSRPAQETPVAAVVDSADEPAIPEVAPANADTKKLFAAVLNDDIKGLEALVADGIDINATGEHDVTALMQAIVAERRDCFVWLLEHDADPDAQDELGRSALNFAVRGKKDDWWLRKLLESGANVNIVNSKGREYAESRNWQVRYDPDTTPIFDAISPHSRTKVQLLIEAGADVNAKNAYGTAVIADAALSRCFEITYLLLEAGADSNVTMLDERTLIDFLEHVGEDGHFSSYGSEPNEQEEAEQEMWYRKVMAFLNEQEAAHEKSQSNE